MWQGCVWLACMTEGCACKGVMCGRGCACKGGGCAWQGGVRARGAYVPCMPPLPCTPPPSVNRITDACKNVLPANFVCGQKLHITV